MILPIKANKKKVLASNKHVCDCVHTEVSAHSNTHTHTHKEWSFQLCLTWILYCKELGNLDIFSLEMYSILFLLFTLLRIVPITILFSTKTKSLITYGIKCILFSLGITSSSQSLHNYILLQTTQCTSCRGYDSSLTPCPSQFSSSEWCSLLP